MKNLIIRFRGNNLDLISMTKEELLALQFELDDAIATISRQLSDAKANFYKTGERADDDWFSRAEYALARDRVSRQKTQLALSIVNKKEKLPNRDNTYLEEARQKRFERAFFDCAKKSLPKEIFEALIDAASDLYQSRSILDG